MYNSSGTIGENVSNSSDIAFVFDGLDNGYYYFNVTVNDSVGNSRTETRVFLNDLISPNVTLLSGMPENNSVGGSRVTFNWSATDNFDTNLTCYPVYTGSQENSSNVVYVENGTQTSVTRYLPGGENLMRVKCYDDGGNVFYSEGINYLVAVINITNPLNGSIVRINSTTNLTIEEIEGKEFLNNATIYLRYSNNSDIYTFRNLVDNNNFYNYSFRWNLSRPEYLNLFAVSFNTSRGIEHNTTDDVQIVLLKPVGETDSPTISYFCPNRTYVLNGSYVKLELLADLDTLLLRANVSVTSPNGSVYYLSPSQRSVDGTGFIDSLNYTFLVNQTGEYFIFANVTDYENQSVTKNYTFYSVSGYSYLKINSSSVSNISIINTCSGKRVFSGDEINLRVFDGELLRILSEVHDPVLDISVVFRDVNVSSNITEAINYSKLTDEVSPPSGQRRVFLFMMNSSLNFSNYTLTLNYSPLEYTLNNESSLRLYKCENISNCDLELVDFDLNESSNTISSTLNNFSVFMLTENALETRTITQTITRTETVSSSSTRNVYVDLNLISPVEASMKLKDKIIIPITVENPSSTLIRDIKLSASSNTSDISPSLDIDKIALLKPKESAKTNLILESHSTPGVYEVVVSANSSSPQVTDTTKIMVNLVEVVGSEMIKERIKLVADLFKENPECLEFNDYVEEARGLLSTDPERARELLQKAMDKCHDAITSKYGMTGFAIQGDDVRWKDPVMIVSILFGISMLIVLRIMHGRRKLRT